MEWPGNVSGIMKFATSRIIEEEEASPGSRVLDDHRLLMFAAICNHLG